MVKTPFEFIFPLENWIEDNSLWGENRVKPHFRVLAFTINMIFIFPGNSNGRYMPFWFNYLLAAFFPYRQFRQSRQRGCSLVSGLLPGNWFLLDHWGSLSRPRWLSPHTSYANIFQYLWCHNKLIHLYHINTALEQCNSNMIQ